MFRLGRFVANVLNFLARLSSGGTEEWWAAELPDPVVEHADPGLPPAAPTVDDALFDAPDLHFGH